MGVKQPFQYNKKRPPVKLQKVKTLHKILLLHPLLDYQDGGNEFENLIADITEVVNRLYLHH